MAGQLLGCSVAWLVRFICLVFSTITKVTQQEPHVWPPPWKCLGSHDHDTFIRNVGGPYHPPFWRCHKPRAGLSNIKRREGGAGGGRSASPRKASHEWCPQDYSIPLVSLDSVYKYAQYSCSTHVGFKLKKKKQGAAPPPCKASHGHDTFIRNIGGPYHPPL